MWKTNRIGSKRKQGGFPKARERPCFSRHRYVLSTQAVWVWLHREVHVNDTEVMRGLLTTPATWAVVGLSNNKDRAAYPVAVYLTETLNMQIVPVHPKAETVYGAPGYATLAEAAAAGPIDVVDVFVRPELAGKVVDEAIEVGAKAVWLQLGVIDEEAAERAKQAGLTVVMDTCPVIEGTTFFDTPDHR